MTENYTRIVRTKEQAHEGAKHLYIVAQMLLKEGKRVRMACAEDENDLSTLQRNFLHGVVLMQIAEKAVMPDGARYAMPVWKEHYRERLLGSTWKSFPVVGKVWKNGRQAVKRVLVRNSTEDMGVKAYSRYIDQVIDLAVTEWGVLFDFVASEREAVRYVSPRRVKQAAREAAEA